MARTKKAATAKRAARAASGSPSTCPPLVKWKIVEILDAADAAKTYTEDEVYALRNVVYAKPNEDDEAPSQQQPEVSEEEKSKIVANVVRAGFKEVEGGYMVDTQKHARLLQSQHAKHLKRTERWQKQVAGYKAYDDAKQNLKAAQDKVQELKVQAELAEDEEGARVHLRLARKKLGSAYTALREAKNAALNPGKQTSARG